MPWLRGSVSAACIHSAGCSIMYAKLPYLCEHVTRRTVIHILPRSFTLQACLTDECHGKSNICGMMSHPGRSTHRTLRYHGYCSNKYVFPVPYRCIVSLTVVT